jgi:sugar lactone lactonase YvrE
MKARSKSLFLLPLLIAGLGLMPAGSLISQGSVLAQAVPQAKVDVAPPPGRQALHGHVPSIAAHLPAVDRLAPSARLGVTIGLPLRNKAEADNLFQQIYDPGSPNYHQYLTPDQFTRRFGPAERDYQTVIDFAKANGLTITGTHPNRTLLDLSGTADRIEKTFHVSLLVYQHPTEARTFFAPDAEPSLDLDVPVLHIGGLDNYIIPRRSGTRSKPGRQNATPLNGSGQYGMYIGNDFRAAYAPGVTFTGSGQTIALFEMDGYYTNDIVQYETTAGLPQVPLTNALVGGFNGEPGGDDVEVALDIEMAVSMAPGLSRIIVYETSNWGGGVDDLLNQIANDNLANQIGCSYETGGDQSRDQIWQQMGMQGQSFFQAAADSGASDFMDDPYVTLVGGTTLTTSGTGGGWLSETTWNLNSAGWGGTDSSGGGVSSQYSIPAWQSGISMSANGGSTTQRNCPDVAIVADNILAIVDNGQTISSGGTSAAAPLWAGFMALVNEQLADDGAPPLGFANPAIYAIGKGTNYHSCFHDIATGNNTNSASPNQFYAVAGYDLCTGWGSPTGSNLINMLAFMPLIASQPQSLLVVQGSNAVFKANLTTTRPGPFNYQWQFNGTNLLGATNSTLTITNAQPANAGGYNFIVFNQYGYLTSAVATLTLVFPPSVISPPATQSVVLGSNVTFSVSVAGTGPLTYQWQFNGTNLPNNLIATVAGGGTGWDGGAATNASLNNPSSVAFDRMGNFYIADSWDSRIRMVNTSGIITTVAGGGGWYVEGEAATNVSLHSPNCVTLDAVGNMFIIDKEVVRKVSTNGSITTVAGNENQGYSYSGDGGPATNAGLNSPAGVAVDAVGNLYISDTVNYRIRKVDTNGIITTVAGGGSGPPESGGAATNTEMGRPDGIACDAAGNLYIADGDYNRIYVLNTSGIITTVAGTNGAYYSGDDGPATNATIYDPLGVALDAAGNVYIADSGNNRIRMVNTSGIITTVAGNGEAGYFGDGAAPTAARLSYATGVAVDAIGNLYIADQGNNRIRKVLLYAGHPSFTLLNVSATNAGKYTVVISGPYGQVTSAAATLTVQPPPISFDTSATGLRITPGGLLLTLNGLTGSDSVILYGSTNLASWTPVYTNPPATGPIQFLDPGATNLKSRFYRAIRSH